MDGMILGAIIAIFGIGFGAFRRGLPKTGIGLFLLILISLCVVFFVIFASFIPAVGGADARLWDTFLYKTQQGLEVMGLQQADILTGGVIFVISFLLSRLRVLTHVKRMFRRPVERAEAKQERILGQYGLNDFDEITRLQMERGSPIMRQTN